MKIKVLVYENAEDRKPYDIWDWESFTDFITPCNILMDAYHTARTEGFGRIELTIKF